MAANDRRLKIPQHPAPNPYPGAQPPDDAKNPLTSQTGDEGAPLL